MYARSQIFVFQSSFREFVPTNNRKTSLKKKKSSSNERDENRCELALIKGKHFICYSLSKKFIFHERNPNRYCRYIQIF